MGLVGGWAGWPVHYLSIKQARSKAWKARRQAGEAGSNPYTASREETDNIYDFCMRNNRSCGLEQVGRCRISSFELRNRDRSDGDS
jgi:hypothetical protein